MKLILQVVLSWLPTYIGTFSETRESYMLRKVISPYTTMPVLQLILTDFNLVHRNLMLLQPKLKAYLLTNQGVLNSLTNQIYMQQKDSLTYLMHYVFLIKLEVIVGAQWKQWVMNSQGTIFADTLGAIKVNETGGYIQLKKKLLNDVLTLSASGRYDKQTNFEGKFTPRFAAVIKVAKDNNIRLSYQTSYRFPSNQNQYISLRLGGGSSFLIGSLPEFQSYYKLNSTKPGYTVASVLNYRAGALADSSRLD